MPFVLFYIDHLKDAVTFSTAKIKPANAGSILL